MPYFPAAADTPPYYCPNCRAWFRPGNVNCCVLHPPGSCCHEYEQPVAPPQIRTSALPVGRDYEIMPMSGGRVR
jgi:hypothetical protein